MSIISGEELKKLLLYISDLPGFDPTGLRVATSWASMWTGTVIGGLDDRGRFEVYWAEPKTIILKPEKPQILCLNLADAPTADRIARWVAAQVGLVLDCTAPQFDWFASPADPEEGTSDVPWFELTAVSPFSTGSRSPVRHTQDLPTLLHLNPYDDRRLPDGSLYIERLALRYVAAHFGGAERQVGATNV